MIPFTLRQLEVFTSVAKANSLSAAAQTLFLSKAAVSLSLNELENQLGHTLFDRINNRLIINSEGTKLLPIADELLHRAHSIQSLFNNAESLSGELRLGASDTIGNQLLPFLIQDFKQKHPAVDFKALLSNSSDLGQKILDYQIDIAFIESNEDSPKLLHHPFGFDQMCVISQADHPLSNKEALTFSDLENMKWLLREVGSGSRDYFINHVAEHLSHWQTEFELSSSEAIINGVTAGLGLACLSELSVDSAIKAGKVKKLNISLPLERSMQIVLHKDKYLNPLLDAFLQYSLAWRLTDHPTKSPTRLDCKE
ncbi:XRE family transcriptional regulator [Vibrio breoganii]|uniref:LysR substrate-binding domain-containing protein n=1 Tax=Vibrio breoganii TaxID=553239 RepID=UPI000C858668|nr:LysR substrate-binding domain-containing protein [Vibrio breoganii]PMF99909.1 XRE family transcriptional regulator [Vibrio breoganii]PMG39206.1 XRE family transcriptional regulator [Vibrio breoganii]PMK32543.1 XRE family transcriptional regulator [Vibrio breoganii]PML39613.1 XRE family transcriptional regulator [Vibrio breoganii]PML84493.1 XRE family transcriptional regulator [Vibrio breoganii]